MECSQVYAVEHAVVAMVDQGGAVNFHGSTLDLGRDGANDVKFGDIPSVQRWVDLVWKDLGLSRKAPVVRQGRGALKAYYTPREHSITMPREDWAFRALVVAHEVAHAVVRTREIREKAHGPQFRKELVSMVREYVSPEAALLLTDGLSKMEVAT